MATLTTIEFLLSLDESAYIELYDVPIEKIKEFAAYFNTKIREEKLNRWTMIRKNKIRIALNTESNPLN